MEIIIYSQCRVRRFPLAAIQLLICLIAHIATVTTIVGQGQQQENALKAGVRQRIAVLMTNTLKERERITPEGRKVWLMIPPLHEAVQEMKSYGDKALPILVEYLQSGAYHERELAMQFISQLGGTRIVEPLSVVIRSDPESTLRQGALTYLTEAPWEVASPILREASKADPDPRVREKADYILRSHEARELKSPPESVIRERIAVLMSYILKKGEAVTSDGTKVSMPYMALPSNEDIEEVTRYGDDAVSILSEYLTSEDGRQKVLAMRFLGNLGGSRIVEPLRAVVERDASPALRDLALRWLTGAPWNLAAPIIREAAENDPDPQLREAARDILKSYAPK